MGVAPSSSAMYDYSDYWVVQDANYNVVGVVNEHGRLSERYEYTPYGHRVVFITAGSRAYWRSHDHERLI